MTDVQQIEIEIAALTARREQLIKEEKEARAALLKTIPIQWEWNIIWQNEFSFRCEKRWTKETTEARKALGDTAKTFSTEYSEWHGMTYAVCLGLNLISTGGGHCVLDSGETWRGNGRKLTEEEYASLVAEKVPASLIHKGWQS
jgi:hypothetical protein